MYGIVLHSFALLPSLLYRIVNLLLGEVSKVLLLTCIYQIVL